MNRPGQQVAIGQMVVDGDAVFAVDQNLPVCIRVDVASGAVVRATSWPVLDTHRRHPIATDMAMHRGSVWISSPAAGGVVRFEADLSSHEVIRLDAMPGPLASLGEDLVVFAYREWASELATDDDIDPSGQERVIHPVIWRDAPEEPHRPTYGWFAYSPDDAPLTVSTAGDPDEANTASTQLPTVMAVSDDDDLDDDDDDDDVVESIRPIWRVTNGAASRIDLGGDAGDGVTLDNGDLITAVRRRTDPLIKVRHGRRGRVGYQYPEAIIAFSPDGASRVVHEFDGTVEVYSFDDQVWVRYDDPEPDSERELLARLDVAIGELRPVDHDREIVAIVDGVAISFDVGRSVESAHREGRTLLRRFDIADERNLDDVAMPDIRLGFYAPMAAVGGRVWFSNASLSALVALSVRSGEVSVIPFEADISSLVPPPSPPTGLDVLEFEERTLGDLREQLLGGWVDEAGAIAPFIEGITFTSFERRGTFPKTTIEVLFHAERQSGYLFGVQVPLFDALGNDVDLSLTAIHLMEFIEAGPGLGAIDSAQPDAAGIVWMTLD